MSYCMKILKRNFSKIFFVKIVIQTHVPNLMYFEGKMVYSFFIQKEALRIKSNTLKKEAWSLLLNFYYYKTKKEKNCYFKQNSGIIPIIYSLSSFHLPVILYGEYSPCAGGWKPGCVVVGG